MNRSTLRRLAALPIVVYLMVVFGMATLQQRLIFPAPKVDGEVLATLARQQGALPLSVQTDDGEKLYGWRIPAKGPGGVLVVHFSGNGSTVGAAPARMAALHAAGLEILHVNYRGYPGSSGAPTEQGLRTDARAVWAEARRTHAAEDILLYGKSLGGGVAVGLAAWASEQDQAPRALIVESSFRSIVELAAELYPWLPVRSVLRHPFDSMALAPSVACPSLVIHGDADALIDVQHGRDLAGALPQARLVEVAGGAHNDVLLPLAAPWSAFVEVAGLKP